MTSETWIWKDKGGTSGRLLYESGNWGDILKMLWLSAVLEWKCATRPATEYLDPFAGDVKYPLSQKALFRFEQARLPQLDFIKREYVSLGLWPSSATTASFLTKGRIRVFDADADRRGRWHEAGREVVTGESGWDILAATPPSSGAVWLVDPYDFLAEWRDRLDMIVDKAADVSVLVYIYNRSASKKEAFADYRAFRNRLDDMRGDLPKRIGRAESDVFLTRAHHEMLFMPGREDRENPGLKRLFAELESRTRVLADAQARAGIYDM